MSKKIPLIPIETICNAINGDPESIAYILQMYRPYIESLATCKAVDNKGDEYLYINDEMRQRLETKLIICIITRFRIL